MKKILFSAIVCLFALSSFSQKYGYIDTDYILGKIPAYETAQQELDGLSESWQQEVEKKYQLA